MIADIISPMGSGGVSKLLTRATEKAVYLQQQNRTPHKHTVQGCEKFELSE